MDLEMAKMIFSRLDTLHFIRKTILPYNCSLFKNKFKKLKEAISKLGTSDPAFILLPAYKSEIHDKKLLRYAGERGFKALADISKHQFYEFT